MATARTARPRSTNRTARLVTKRASKSPDAHSRPVLHPARAAPTTDPPRRGTRGTAGGRSRRPRAPHKPSAINAQSTEGSEALHSCTTGTHIHVISNAEVKSCRKGQERAQRVPVPFHARHAEDRESMTSDCRSPIHQPCPSAEDARNADSDDKEGQDAEADAAE